VDETVKVLIEGVKKTDVRSIARLITLVENGSRAVLPAMRQLYPLGGSARVVGVTGPTGVGKSCLVDCLIGTYRRAGKSVGVIAVDPSSPFTGGAILGDRIRMQEHADDPGVFIRSMASRRHQGGLAAATSDAVTILDAAGWNVILLETVGIGQIEVEVSTSAQTSVLVLAPNTGDEMQRMKAGIMEIADIFVVNKADMGGADIVEKDLQQLLDSMSSRTKQSSVVACSATRSEGIDELVRAISEHHQYLSEHDLLKQAVVKRVRSQVLSVAQSTIEEMLTSASASSTTLDRCVERVLKGETDPVTAGEELARQLPAERD